MTSPSSPSDPRLRRPFAGAFGVPAATLLLAGGAWLAGCGSTPGSPARQRTSGAVLTVSITPNPATTTVGPSTREGYEHVIVRRCFSQLFVAETGGWGVTLDLDHLRYVDPATGGAFFEEWTTATEVEATFGIPTNRIPPGFHFELDETDEVSPSAPAPFDVLEDIHGVDDLGNTVTAAWQHRCLAPWATLP